MRQPTLFEKRSGGGAVDAPRGVLYPLGGFLARRAGVGRGGPPPEREREYRAKLTEALTIGYDILKKGGPGLDAVEAAIRFMEDSPLFNAGKGAVFTSEGTNELDASIMDGRTLKAGAVAGVKRVKNPITLARLVMDESPHVMMVGDGAEAFAAQKGVELVDPKYFYTEERWQQLQRIKEAEKQKAAPPGRTRLERERLAPDEQKF